MLCLSLLIIGLDNTILNVALPTLQRDLGATQGELQWAVDAYIVVFAPHVVSLSWVALPVFAADVPAYHQMYSLSCEYAAAYIATSAFGWGIPESAFIERMSSAPYRSTRCILRIRNPTSARAWSSG